MAASVVQSNLASGSASVSLTNTVTGRAFVVSACYDLTGGSNPSLADNQGNTFTGTRKINIVDGAGLAIWVLENGTGGATHTFTVSGVTTAAMTVIAIEVTGAATASYDAAVTASGIDSASPYALTSGTPAQADELFVGFASIEAGGTFTYVAASWTKEREQGDNNTYYGHALFSRAVADGAAKTLSVTAAGSASDSTMLGIVGLKSAGSTAYDLTVDPAAYSLTVAAETLQAARALTVAPTSYAVTAAAETLVYGRALNFSPASYSLTAVAEVLQATRVLSIDPASYALTASNETLSVGKTLHYAPVSYSLTTSAETLTVARSLSISPTAYALGAADVALEYASLNKEMVIEPASYVLSAAEVSLGYSGLTTEEQKSYSSPKRKKTYNYDYSSPKAEVVEVKAKPAKATKKQTKQVPADVAEMLALLESSQASTASVLVEQMAVEKSIQAEQAAQLQEEDEMVAIIAMCL